MTLECTMAINGVRMYFLDGKHVSQKYARKYAFDNNMNISRCVTVSESTHLNRKRKKIKELVKMYSELTQSSQMKDIMIKDLKIIKDESEKLKNEFEVQVKLNEKRIEDIINLHNNEKKEIIKQKNQLQKLNVELKNDKSILESSIQLMKDKLIETIQDNEDIKNEAVKNIKKLIDAEDNNKLLNEFVDKLKRKIFRLIEELKKLKTKYENEKEELIKYHSDLNRQDMSSFEIKISELEEKLKENERNFNKKKEEYESEILELNIKLSEQDIVFGKSSEEFERKISEFASKLEENKISFENKKNEYMIEIENLKNKIKKQNEKDIEKDKKIADLKKENIVKNKMYDDIIKQNRQNIDKLTNEIELIKKQKEEKEIKPLQSLVSSLQTQIKNKEDELLKLKSKSEGLQSQVDYSQSNYKTLEFEYKKEKEAYKRDKQNLQSDIERLKSELEQAKKIDYKKSISGALPEKIKSIESEKQLKQEHERQIQEKQKQIDELKQNIINVESEKQEINRLHEEQINRYNNTIIKLKNDFSEKSKQDEQKQIEINRLNEKLSFREKIYNDTVSDYETKINELNSKLLILSEDNMKNDANSNKIIDLETKIEELTKKLQNEEENYKEEKDSLLTKIQMLEKEKLLDSDNLKRINEYSTIASQTIINLRGQLKNNENIYNSNKDRYERQLEEKEKQLLEKDEEIRVLKSKTEELKTDVKNLTKVKEQVISQAQENKQLNREENSGYEKQIAYLDTQIEEKDKQMLDYKEQIEKLQKDINNITSGKSDISELYNKLQEEYTTTKEELNKRIADISSENSQKDKEISSLNDSLSNDRKIISDLEEEIKEKNIKIIELEKERDLELSRTSMFKKNEDKLEDENSKLLKNLKSSEKEIEKLKDEISSLERKIRQKEEDMSKKAFGVSIGSSALDFKEKQIKQLEKKLSDDTKELKNLIKEKQDEIDKLKIEIQELKTSSSTTIEEKEKNLSNIIEEKENKIKELTNELKSSENEISLLKQKNIEDINKINKELNNLTQEKQIEISRLNEKLSIQEKIYNDTVNKYEDEKRTLNSNIQKRENEISKLQTELMKLDKIKNEIIEKSKESKKLSREDSSSYQKQVEYLDSQIEVLNLQIQEKDRQINEMNMKKEENETKIRDLEMKILGLQSKIDSLQKDLQNKSSKLELTEKQRSLVVDKSDEYESKLRELTNKIVELELENKNNIKTKEEEIKIIKETSEQAIKSKIKEIENLKSLESDQTLLINKNNEEIQLMKSRLEKDIQNKEEEIKTIKNRFEEEIQSKEEEIRKVIQTNQEFLQKLDEANRKIAENDTMISNLQIKIKELENTSELIQSKAITDSDTNKTLLIKLQQEKDDLVNEVKSSKERIEELEKENKTLKDTIFEKEQKNIELDLIIKELQSNKQKTQEDILNYEKQVSSLEQIIKEKEDEINKKNAELTEERRKFLEDIKILTNSSLEEGKQKEAFKQQIQEIQENINKITIEKENLSKEKAQLEGEYKIELEILKNKNKSYSNEISDLRATITRENLEKNTTIKGLRDEIQIKDNKNKELEKNLEELSNIQETLRSNIQEFEIIKSQLNEEKDRELLKLKSQFEQELEKKNIEIQNQAEGIDKRIKEEKEKLERMFNDKFQESITEKNKEIDIIKRQIQEKEKEIEENKQEIENIKKELTSNFSKQIAEKDRIISEKDKDFSNMIAEKDRIISKKDEEFSKEIKEKQKDIEEKEKQLKKLRFEYNAIKDKLDVKELKKISETSFESVKEELIQELFMLKQRILDVLLFNVCGYLPYNDKQSCSINKPDKSLYYPLMLQMMSPEKETGEDNFKGPLNILRGIAKVLFLIIKMFTRSPNFMRLISIDSKDFNSVFKTETTTTSQINEYKKTINSLYFTPVPKELIEGSVNNMKTGLGPELYEEFMNRVKKDTISFNSGSSQGLKSPSGILSLGSGSKLLSLSSGLGLKPKESEFTSSSQMYINTESLIKYIIIILENISTDEKLKEYSKLTSYLEQIRKTIIDISKILREGIIQTDNLFSLNDIILSDVLKDAHNKPENIYTFVKIRSDENEINERFSVKVDGKDTTMFIKYDPTPVSFYKKTLDKNNQPIVAKTDYLKKGINYRDNYVFGPFTKVFNQSYSNKDIADSYYIKQLVQKLINKNPIVIVGYGASGAGKTSTLINFFNRKTGISEPGVMMYMTKEVGKSGFNKVEVSFIELEGDVTANKKEDAINKFKSIPSVEDINNKKEGDKHPYLPQMFKYNGEEWQIDLSKEAFNKRLEPLGLTEKSTLGEYIVDIMDKQRNVKATTNNPESSRSHMIICLKFINPITNQETHLIVCDFAGVENKFDCDDSNTLEKFVNIKGRDGLTNFYQKEISDYIKEKGNLGKTLEEIELTPKFNLQEPFTKQVIDYKTRQDYINNKIFIINDKNLNLLNNAFLNVDNELGKLKQIDENFSKIDSKYNIKGFKTNEKVEKITPYQTNNLFRETKPFSEKSDLRNLIYVISGNSPIITKDDKGSIKAQEIIEDLYKINPSTKINKMQMFKNNLEKIKAELTSQVAIASVCMNRVNEGYFINDSLEKLRMFITQFILNINKNKSLIIPPFSDVCLPLQCNPYFEECFGPTPSTLETYNKSVIMNKIKERLCGVIKNIQDFCPTFNDMNIVIFNVLNLSKLANNPPPSPFTDITSLMLELSRLETLKNNTELNAFRKDGKLYPINKEPFVKELFLVDIANRDTIQKYEQSVINQIKSYINRIDGVRTSASEYNTRLERSINLLKEFIDYMNKLNAVSAIGTMQFVDLIAKYGINNTICNYDLPSQEKFNQILSKTSIVPDLQKTFSKVLTDQRISLLDLLGKLFTKDLYSK